MHCVNVILKHNSSIKSPPPSMFAPAIHSNLLAFKIKASQQHANVTYFHLKGTTRLRSGHRPHSHNMEPQVHRAENRLCRIRCLQTRYSTNPHMLGSMGSHFDLFEYSFPNRISSPLTNQTVRNLQVSAGTSKEM